MKVDMMADASASVVERVPAAGWAATEFAGSMVV